MNGSQNTYDAVPYDSYASRLTHISHLNLIGRLFGMRPADVDRCRVLELGGAGGGNLIPMAAEFPRSEFICVDLSAAQIDEGRRHASALGLANLRFETMSIMDFPRSEGAFDYFICHGVYSWVPAPVQDKIFAIAREHLTPEGIAMVSYNALPGWNMVRSVRDLMQYHTAGITDTVAKTAKARAILNFINESLKAATGPWADTIRAETRMLARAPDYYLMHEHLEENNEPCYLHQFMERAAACELQYLGDAEAKAMYMGNLSPLVSESLAPLTDRARSEQYMDFVTNRRFRHTLLCRASLPLTTAISPAVIDGLYIRSALVAQTPARMDAGVPVAFTGPGNLKFSVTDTLTKVVLLALAESAAVPMSVEEIIAKIVARNESIDADAARAVLKRHALHLFFAGGITLNARPPTYASRCAAKPVAFPIARYQASFRQLVTNGRHEMVTLSPIECVIIQLLDGTHTPESLVAPVSAQLVAQGLSVLRDGKAIANQAEMERELAAYCGKVLQTFAAQGLLQA
jgi:methyltransferase-like protein/2-polyprenyl-3-methyl-5-hydroxy-6-metoxy-1,4-benzoquinol methylase